MMGARDAASKVFSRHRYTAAAIVFIALDLVLVAALYAAGSYSCLNKAYDFARETVTFLENTCSKYDNYVLGTKAEALQKLDDAARAFGYFLPEEQVGVDDDLLHEYVTSQHVSGMMVLDDDGNMLAHYDADGRDPAYMWADTIKSASVQAIFHQGHSTYSDVTTQRGVDFAVVVSPYGDGAVLLYRAMDDFGDQALGYSIGDVLENNTFHKSPVVMISRDGELVSSNSDQGNASMLRAVSNQDIAWTDDSLTSVDLQGARWYAYKSAYRDYTFYLVYPKTEVMASRWAFVVLGAAAYLVLSVVVLLIRGIYDRRNLRETEKQLETINAISKTYKSTFLLHLDTMEMEGINMSEEVARVFAEKPDPQEFLEQVCRDVVLPEYRDALIGFMDLSTLSARLAAAPFLGLDIQDSRGIWYSVQLIPQSYDSQGHLGSILIATRDITSVKRAEELSYIDKLTGLHNRNYLESHSRELLAPEALPVSVIMADCNYLKRTNDTLGHEWGDRLLQRMAAVLREVAGKDDLPMRVGGDEFLLVCPHTTYEQAESLVVMMRDGLEMVSDEVLRVSASFGISTVEDACTSMSEAFKAADEAMYVEKVAVHAADAGAADDPGAR